jgi:hypothetical protein
VDEFPADAAALANVPRDAAADLGEAGELLDIDVDQLAGMGALVAADRRGRRQILQLAQPEPAQDPTDGPARRRPVLAIWSPVQRWRRSSAICSTMALYLSVAKLAARGELGGGREPVCAWGERARG